MKKFIKLTESDLHRIIKSSVKAYLKENQQIESNFNEFSDLENKSDDELEKLAKKAYKLADKSFDRYMDLYRWIENDLDEFYEHSHSSNDPTNWIDYNFDLTDYTTITLFDERLSDIENDYFYLAEIKPRKYYITLINEYIKLYNEMEAEYKRLDKDYDNKTTY